jgi:hypothetical protein
MYIFNNTRREQIPRREKLQDSHFVLNLSFNVIKFVRIEEERAIVLCKDKCKFPLMGRILYRS